MLARLAERQHGVVARRQLAERGMGRGAIANRIARGRLHIVHRGVYAVGRRSLSMHGRWMAAVLATGPGAVLSHRSAGSLWGILRSSRPVTDVTAVRRRGTRDGIAHHRRCLPSDEVTVRDRIPVTTVPRTLFDLAAVLELSRLERAIEAAEARRLTDSLSVTDLLARHPRRRGVATLRAALAGMCAEPAHTRSELEDLFLEFLDRHSIPKPEVNAGIEAGGRWMECDCVWRSRRVVVELDGHATHRTAAAFERDRARDRALQAAGWRVVRVTWRQLHNDGNRLAADLKGLVGNEQSLYP